MLGYLRLAEWRSRYNSFVKHTEDESARRLGASVVSQWDVCAKGNWNADDRRARWFMGRRRQGEDH